MSPTRRTFLKASSGALGACALGAPMAQGSSPEGAPDGERTKIYTVFLWTAPSPLLASSPGKLPWDIV